MVLVDSLHRRRRTDDEHGIEGLAADTYRKSLSWVVIALAMLGVVGFGFGAELRPLVKNYLSRAPLLSLPAMLLLIDWSRVSTFQKVSVVSSVLTLAMAVGTHSLVVDSTVRGREDRVKKGLCWLGYLVKWKSGFGAVSIVLVMLYMALYANAVHGWLPIYSWAADWLHWLYGANAEALLVQH
jgi:hypothetical protein